MLVKSMGLLLALLAGLVIDLALIPVVVYRLRRKPSRPATGPATISSQFTNLPTQCMKCGAELPPASNFCNKCGAKQEG